MTSFLDSKHFVQLVNDPTQDDGRTIDHCYVPNDIKDSNLLDARICNYHHMCNTDYS
jgi:hypothetical protein